MAADGPAVAAAAAAPSSLRRLEDEWTGQWNGEWTAPTDDYVYECNDDNCDGEKSSSSSGGGGMWIDGDPEEYTPEQIITYVSIGILSFMTLLCCFCYPEIIVVGCGKMCGCCPGANKGKPSAGEEDDDLGGDYVGGAQGGKTKKKRRKSSKSSSSRIKDVELV